MAATCPSMTPLEQIDLISWASHSTSSVLEGNFVCKSITFINCRNAPLCAWQLNEVLLMPAVRRMPWWNPPANQQIQQCLLHLYTHEKPSCQSLGKLIGFLWYLFCPQESTLFSFNPIPPFFFCWKWFQQVCSGEPGCVNTKAKGPCEDSPSYQGTFWVLSCWWGPLYC